MCVSDMVYVAGVQAGVKLGYDEAALYENFETLDTLLVDFTPDVNKMTGADWAVLASDTNALFTKLVLLKVLALPVRKSGRASHGWKGPRLQTAT
jgi:hypothetical protein